MSGPPDLPDSSQTSQMSSAAFKRPLRWPPGIQIFQIVVRPPRWAPQFSRNAVHYGHRTHSVTLGYSVFNQSISWVNNGLVGSIEVAIGAPKTLKASKPSILTSLNSVKRFERTLGVRHSLQVQCANKPFGSLMVIAVPPYLIWEPYQLRSCKMSDFEILHFSQDMCTIVGKFWIFWEACTIFEHCDFSDHCVRLLNMVVFWPRCDFVHLNIFATTILLLKNSLALLNHIVYLEIEKGVLGWHIK